MRTHVAIPMVLVLVLAGATKPARSADETQFDWTPWNHLAIQDGGRQKPLDTLSWETFRFLANRTKFQDPDTGQSMDRNQLYMALLFDWRGWDQPNRQAPASGPHGHAQYFGGHQPDKWDRAPLLRVDYLQLRSELDMTKGDKYISPFDLSQATVTVPGTHREQPFLIWAESLLRQEQDELTEYETKALETADRFWSYQDHRMGNRFRILPVEGDKEQTWMSIAQLLRADLQDNGDLANHVQEARQQFLKARTAYLANTPTAFNEATQGFIAAVNQSGPQLGTYPAQSKMDLEVIYNRWVPFRFAWVFMTLAFLSLMLSMGTNWKSLLWGGWITFTLGSLAIIVGFAMRITISGRAPVTNMYESVLYVSLGVAVIGAIFELIYRNRYVLTASAAVATIGLILADNCPAVLDPSLRPLQPVLRSNFWLVTHVMTITLSYAAFALAMGIGNITLGYFLAGATNRKAISSLTTLTYRAMQFGVLLLAAGTILGGIWADYSWGRFWGWDPKEVWALVALLGYLAVLHARFAGWVRQFGIAALSVICFSLVVMAWYGVNFVLGAGLHSYGFGGGGAGYVFSALALQGLYVAIAGLRYASRQQEDRASELARASARPARTSLLGPQAGHV